MAKPKKTPADTPEKQYGRFKEISKEVEADETPQALDRAFARLDTKKKDTRQPAKQTAKRK